MEAIAPFITLLLTMLVVGTISVALAVRRINREIEDAEFQIDNPFALKTALQFTLVLTAVTVAGYFVHEFFGNTGLYVTAFVSVYAAGGPIIISSIMLAGAGQITYVTAATVVMIASISSASNDAIIQFFCGARKLAVEFVRISAPMLLAGLAALGVVWLLGS